MCVSTVFSQSSLVSAFVYGATAGLAIVCFPPAYCLALSLDHPEGVWWQTSGSSWWGWGAAGRVRAELAPKTLWGIRTGAPRSALSLAPSLSRGFLQLLPQTSQCYSSPSISEESLCTAPGGRQGRRGSQGQF